jgi:hypothetical protein
MQPSTSEKAAMESKTPLLPQAQESAPTHDATMLRPQSKRKVHAVILSVLFALFWLARTWSCEHEDLDVRAKVPLDVHIM